VSLRNTGRLAVGVKPRYVAFSIDGSHAYVVNEGSDSVSPTTERSAGSVRASSSCAFSPAAAAPRPQRPADSSSATVANA